MGHTHTPRRMGRAGVLSEAHTKPVPPKSMPLNACLSSFPRKQAAAEPASYRRARMWDARGQMGGRSEPGAGGSEHGAAPAELARLPEKAGLGPGRAQLGWTPRG